MEDTEADSPTSDGWKADAADDAADRQMWADSGPMSQAWRKRRERLSQAQQEGAFVSRVSGLNPVRVCARVCACVRVCVATPRPPPILAAHFFQPSLS